MTLDQWRIVATVCEALLDLDTARACGSITGGPTVDVKHCRWMVQRARAQGIITASDTVNLVTWQLIVSCGGSAYEPVSTRESA